MWAQIENGKRRHLERMGNIKKVQNHEYNVSEESREEMDVENPKSVTKAEIDYTLTNRPDIFTDLIDINQVNIGSNNNNISFISNSTELD